MRAPLRPPFSRVGNKVRLAQLIISYMPEHKKYVECFLGSGAVFFQKPLSNENLVNDFDKNIYDTMCDISQVDKIDFELIPNVNATKEIFFELLNDKTRTIPEERLFRNMFLIKYSFSANMVKLGYKNMDSWRHHKLTYLKRHLPDYQEKLRNTIITNKDFREVIRDNDDNDTLFYLDPPYSKNKTYWNYGLPFITNNELAEVLKTIKGKFIMSYDYTEENRMIFKDFNIILIDVLHAVKSKTNKMVKEMLIMNFTPPLSPHHNG